MKWGRAQALIKAIILKNFKQLVDEEIGAQRQNALLLVPVLVGMGVGAYFSLPFEPPVFVGGLAFLLFLFGVFFTKSWARLVLVAGLFISLGFTAAQIRTSYVYAPMLERSLKFADAEGRIERVERFEKGVRLTLSDVRIEKLESWQTPAKIRLKLWKAEGYQIGQRITGLASLNPPSPPVVPRGFDFQKYMYFKQIGAVGFFYKSPEVLEDVSSGGVGNFISKLRLGISNRISRGLDMPASSLASALMIGERQSVPDENMEAIRAAGLAHMLAISGLHVGLFSGVIFFVTRFVMASIPILALRHPIKKYAAIIAMVGAFFYMLIAGATIPTQRAMITVAVVFTAILLDRSPISLRVIGFAALCILLIFPESLLSASFQMSFAAVTGLVVFYDWTRPLWMNFSRQAGWGRKILLYIGGVSVTTVVATIVTAPITLYHFQALAAYGLLANLLCVPLLAFVIMPLAILLFILMPFGLEGWAFALMEPALLAIIRLAHFVSELDGSVFHVPMFSLATMVFFVLAALSFMLLQGRLRLIGTALFFVLSALSFRVLSYDVYVSSKADIVVVRGENGLVVSDFRMSKFERENWQQANGLASHDIKKMPKEGELGTALSCDQAACRYEGYEQKVSYLKSFDTHTFALECDWADVVISKDVYEGQCGATHIVNRREVSRHGVHAMRLTQEGVVVDRVEDFRADRPWVQRYKRD